MLQFATTVFAALLGSLGAGAIGFFFALRQFRRQKSFDHRLDWHEKTVRQLIDASEKLRKVAVSAQIDELSDDLEQLFDEAISAMPNVTLLIEAEMYASRDSYRALKHAWRDQGELALANVQIQNTIAQHEDLDPGQALSSKIVDTVAKSLLHAASRLASDVRTTLDLEPLEKQSRLYDDDKLQSLDDRTNMTALERAKRIRAHTDIP
jgi:hypothetical protein